MGLLRQSPEATCLGHGGGSLMPHMQKQHQVFEYVFLQDILYIVSYFLFIMFLGSEAQRFSAKDTDILGDRRSIYRMIFHLDHAFIICQMFKLVNFILGHKKLELFY